ncbi:MAG: bifunctional N(6)-L-threonylcarbamoyladenine synthase/serine/threonine protein kinase [Candidatus Aenigmatarchaeota archaeon]|nr:MAG: bifunctional N(6)-L-threonylcarbamoyladenine synthase/serine/threonine protein kinase [Candidatus Aenigmarchaeota archaeon]
MICLGVEATAHTFGVAVVDGKGRVLSNERDTYRPKKGWGIVPMDARNHHEEKASKVMEAALKKAGKAMEDVDIIAFSQGPGLPPCLYAGMNFSVELAKKTKKPLLGVNHCIAHIEIGRLTTKLKDPVTLYVSGANTQIIAHAAGKYRIFGETQDIGIGNALDKFGREAGLTFPYGPEIEKHASGGRWIGLPYVVKGMDLSFSGIVTEAIKRREKGEKLKDVCFSIQETMFAMVTEVIERALAHTGKSEVMLTGGVAANKRLQEMIEIMCRERGARSASVPWEYCGDNAAMIAWTGIIAHRAKQKPLNLKKAEVLPRWRTDQVDADWV